MARGEVDQGQGVSQVGGNDYVPMGPPGNTTVSNTRWAAWRLSVRESTKRLVGEGTQHIIVLVTCTRVMKAAVYQQRQGVGCTCTSRPENTQRGFGRAG